ncbi:MAG: glycosyltransferase [Cyanobacteria bacterium]|jgi:glycosyltransferase involved in cell wall biosynthesis|nr:glycosyltransferase [Cyanobacteria bacterium GSL.Bin1]
MTNTPDVSVVIPTYKRPKLVLRAINSALSQTLKSIEVIVVVDGPDPEVANILSTVEDPRFKFIVLPQNVKLAGARNAGVQVAQSTWVAFLDDDDEWMPEKLEKQLSVARSSKYSCPIVVSRYINKTPSADFIWPRRLPSGNEHLSDYLFVRNSLFQGEGAFLPSTYFTKKEFLVEFPFENNKHEDYDWLLRVNASIPGLGIEYVPEPLVLWHSHEGVGEKRLSQLPDWKYSLEWLNSAKDLMTKQAYSSFLMTHVASPASAQRDWSAFWFLLSEAVRKGKPRPLDFLLYLAMWLITRDRREKIRAFFTKDNRNLKTTVA